MSQDTDLSPHIHERSTAPHVEQGHHRPIRVYLLLAIGILTFGLSPILVRFAGETDPLLLAAGRLLFSILLLFPFWLRSGSSPAEMKLQGVKLYWPILAGIILGFHFVLWISSIQLTSVASASVLVTMHPVLLIVLEYLFFKNRFPLLTWAGVLIALAGSILLGVADSGGVYILEGATSLFPTAPLGNLLAFLAAVLFAFYFLIGRSIRQKTSWINYVFYVYVSATVTTLLTLCTLSGCPPELTRIAILISFFLAIGPTLIGHGAMNYAVKYFSATLLATLILAEAVLASLMAFFLFGEVPSMLSLFAMGVIVFGITFTWKKAP